MLFRVLTIAALASALCLQSSTALAAPPPAPIRPVTDEFYGMKIQDPYRYMENLDDPTVMAWIKAQAAYTDSIMSLIPGRDSLLMRIDELDAGSPYRIFGVQRLANGEMFYYRQAATDNLAKLCLRDSLTGKERVLIDPSGMKTPTGGHFSIAFQQPSQDGSHLLYGLAPSGSEETILYVFDVAAMKNLPDSVDRLETAYTNPQWLPDGKGFFYWRRRALDPEAPVTEIYKRTKAYVHFLGTPLDDDRLVLGIDQWDNVPLDPIDFPSIVVTPGSDYVVAKIKHGDSNQLTLYTAQLTQLISGVMSDISPWKMVCDVADSVTDFSVFKNDIYLLSSRNAPRFKLVRESLASPGFADAKTIIPPGATVLNNLHGAKDALYVGVRRDASRQIVRVGYGASPQITMLELPDSNMSATVTSASPAVDGIYLNTTSWTKEGATYSYDPATGEFTNTELNPPSKYAKLPGCDSKEVLVDSYDGTKVPLSIIYPKDIKLDGNNPTLLDGYGSYGITLDAYYDPKRIAWLERGGILAIAHVRGGGVYGEGWHLAGQMTTKPNTWKDFIACAEYLIKQGYTSSKKLAGEGGSAGGILIGRAITARPDLFRAALINVGATDMIRMEHTTNGVPNIREFGTVKNEKQFHALLEMSAYNHVKDGVAYPAVMLSHGINDPRVAPWMSAKMTARLQKATSSDRPILLRVDFDAGHGIGSTKSQRNSGLADRWAFLLWQFGEKGFQPR